MTYVTIYLLQHVGGTYMVIERSNNLTFAADSLVLICGLPKSGKSTFASKYLFNFSVIDIDDIYAETEHALNWNEKSTSEQFDLRHNFLKVLNSKLTTYINRSLRANDITFVIVNATTQLARQIIIKRFSGRYQHCSAIVLDIDKNSLTKQNHQNDDEIDDFLSHFDDFKKQIDNNDFDEFELVYIVENPDNVQIDIT